MEKQNKKIRIIMAVSSIVLAIFLTVSTTHGVRNIRSAADLKGKKVLAGRFVFFINDKPVPCKGSGFSVGFKKQGDMRAKRFKPDKNGYVYVAVSEGNYNIIDNIGKKPFRFRVHLIPVVQIYGSDSVVNFGAFEVRFFQSRGSKTDLALEEGRPEAYLKYSHIPDYDLTSSEIAERVGGFAGPVRNGSLSVIERGKSVSYPDFPGEKEKKRMAAIAPQPEDLKKVRIGVSVRLDRRYLNHLTEVLEKSGDCLVLELPELRGCDTPEVAERLREKYQIDMVIFVSLDPPSTPLGTAERPASVVTELLDISGRRVVELDPIKVMCIVNRLRDIAMERKVISKQIEPIEEMIDSIKRRKKETK